MTLDEWVTLIGAVAAAIVTVLNGVSLRRRLEVIHEDTNGSLTGLKTQVSYLKDRLDVRRTS